MLWLWIGLGLVPLLALAALLVGLVVHLPQRKYLRHTSSASSRKSRSSSSRAASRCPTPRTCVSHGGRPDAARLLPASDRAAPGRHPVRPGVRLQPLVVRAVLRAPAGQRLRRLRLRDRATRATATASRATSRCSGSPTTRCSDVQAALAYLKERPDADPRGVGFFGISKGGSAGLLAAADDPYVRCFVTDGIFATYTTMVPYMRKWIRIYSDHRTAPGTAAARGITAWWAASPCGASAGSDAAASRTWSRRCRRLAPRPLLMIHGGGDTYIKPEMARALFDRAGQPKEFWLVEGAKHNQALQRGGDEYRRRVLEFFQTSPGRNRRGLPAAGPMTARSIDLILASGVARRSAARWAARYAPRNTQPCLSPGCCCIGLGKIVRRAGAAAAGRLRGGHAPARAKCRRRCCGASWPTRPTPTSAATTTSPTSAPLADFRRQLPVAGYEYFEPYIAARPPRRAARPAGRRLRPHVRPDQRHHGGPQVHPGHAAVPGRLPPRLEHLGPAVFRDHQEVKLRPIVQMSGDWQRIPHRGRHPLRQRHRPDGRRCKSASSAGCTACRPASAASRTPPPSITRPCA